MRGIEFYSRRRRILTALILSSAVLAVEIFVITIYSAILYGLRLYLAVTAAILSAILLFAYVVFTTPSASKRVYAIRVEVLSEDPEDSIEEAIINEALLGGSIRPTYVARSLGTTPYRVVEKIYEMEREGKLRIVEIKLEEARE